MNRFLTIFIFLASIGVGIAQAREPLKLKNTPDKELVGEIEAVLLLYRSELKHWPTDIKELQRYAKKTGQGLNLSKFSKITLKRKSPDTVLIVCYVEKPKYHEIAFAVTVVDVEPGQGRQPSVSKTDLEEPNPAMLLKQIQWELGQRGYDPGSVDGVMGPRTRKAIKKFQRDQGLTVDGKPSIALLKVIVIPCKQPEVSGADIEPSRSEQKSTVDRMGSDQLGPTSPPTDLVNVRDRLKSKMWPNHIPRP